MMFLIGDCRASVFVDLEKSWIVDTGDGVVTTSKARLGDRDCLSY
jgi:hypothetical protein